MEEGNKELLQAILAVLMERRSDESKKARKDEVFLADSGMKSQDIANVLGKSHAAVIKAIQRAKKEK